MLTTADVVAVGFELGVTELIRREDEDTVVGHLGPDLLGPDWGCVCRRCAAGRAPGGADLVAALDQRNLAGIGNVYANELCFLRGAADASGGRGRAGGFVDLAERMLQANKDRWVRSTTGDLRPVGRPRGCTDDAGGRAGAARACSAENWGATCRSAPSPGARAARRERPRRHLAG